MYHNRILRRIFGHNKEEVPRKLRTFRNEELQNFLLLIKFWRVIILIMRRTGQTECVRRMRNAYKIPAEKLEENENLVDLSRDGRDWI